MSKHTKGEWAVSDDGYGARIEPSIAWIGYGSAHSKAEHQANARLISGAAEMLEALKELIRVGAIDDGNFPHLVSQVKEAIKKAEGGE